MIKSQLLKFRPKFIFSSRTFAMGNKGKADIPKDTKSQPNPTETEPKMEDKKQTKHIYKSKEDRSDVRVDEMHAYREGFDEGYYVREKMSFVYYEVPSTSQGRTAESSGKTVQEDLKDTKQAEDIQDKDERNKQNKTDATKTAQNKSAESKSKEEKKDNPDDSYV